MHYKLKYSSLLSFKKKKNSTLHIKGPLGTNYIKVPSSIKLVIDRSNQTITFFTILSKSEKKKKFARIFIYIF